MEKARRVTAVQQDLQIKAPDLQLPVETLSGGNRQKVVLSKWLCSGTRVFLN